MEFFRDQLVGKPGTDAMVDVMRQLLEQVAELTEKVDGLTEEVRSLKPQTPAARQPPKRKLPGKGYPAAFLSEEKACSKKQIIPKSARKPHRMNSCGHFQEAISSEDVRTRAFSPRGKGAAQAF